MHLHAVWGVTKQSSTKRWLRQAGIAREKSTQKQEHMDMPHMDRITGLQMHRELKIAVLRLMALLMYPYCR
jgi:hypothetical protein